MPLKWIAGACSTRCTGLPQTSTHVSSASSVNRCTSSKRWPFVAEVVVDRHRAVSSTSAARNAGTLVSRVPTTTRRRRRMLARAPACASRSSPTTTTRSSAASPSTSTDRRAARRARARGDRRHRPAAAHAPRSPTRTSARCATSRFEVVRTGRRRCRSTATPRRRMHTVPPRLVAVAAQPLPRARSSTSCTCTRPTTRACRAIAPLAIPKGTIGVGTYHSVFSPRRRCSTSFAPDPAPLARQAATRTSSSPRPASARSRRTSRFDCRVIPNGIDERHFSPDAEPLPELREGGKPRDPLPRALRPAQRTRRRCSTRSSGARASTRERCGCASSATGRCGNVLPAPARPSASRRDVVWAGRVDWSRPRYYASADVHCTPCQRASFGMVLLEAMSCGRPVVASRISGFQLLMEHGKQGLLVEPADDAEPLRRRRSCTCSTARPSARAWAARAASPPSRATPGRASPGSSRQLYDELLGRKRVMKKLAGRPALRRCLGRRDRRRRRRSRASSARRSPAGPAGRSSRVVCAARAALGLGVVHAQLAALRPRRRRARHERPRARADVRRRARRPSGRRACSTRCATRGARATFFVLGRHAERAPRARRAAIRDEGHEIASHGYDHALLTFASQADVDAPARRAPRPSLADGARRAAAAALFRAPHGFRNPFVRARDRAPRLRVVGWTKGVWDTAKPGVETIVRRTDRRLPAGRRSCCCTTPTAAARATTAARPPRRCPRSSSARTPPATSS